MAKLLGWNVDKIYFYPYGGYTKFNDDLNKPKEEELLIMLAGPVIQIIYFFIITFFLENNNLELFKSYHLSILFFNLLPIYPLDGGKLLNIILNYFLSFRKSFKMTIGISYLVILSIIIIFFKKEMDLSLSLFMVIILVFCKLTDELKKEKFYFNKFLLERYIKEYKFPKIKVIKSIGNMSRDYKHVIFNKNKTRSEKEELSKYFRQ